MAELAKNIENLDYAAQAQLFRLLGEAYWRRSHEDEAAHRPVLANKGLNLRTLAFTMQGALEAMSKSRPAPPRQRRTAA